MLCFDMMQVTDRSLLKSQYFWWGREKYLLLRIVEVTSITCINELLNSVDFTQGVIFVQGPEGEHDPIAPHQDKG